MIRCPLCKSEASRVLQTYNEGEGRDRKRFCLNCGASYLTNETVSHVMERGSRPEPTPPPAPKKEPKPRGPAKFHPVTEASAGSVFGALPGTIQGLLLEWWNVSRRQRHPGAAWTETAWSQSVLRVGDLLQEEGVERAQALAAAGAEHGWQALKPEYLAGSPATATAAAPSREGSAVSAIHSLLRAADA